MDILVLPDSVLAHTVTAFLLLDEYAVVTRLCHRIHEALDTVRTRLFIIARMRLFRLRIREERPLLELGERCEVLDQLERINMHMKRVICQQPYNDRRLFHYTIPRVGDVIFNFLIISQHMPVRAILISNGCTVAETTLFYRNVPCFRPSSRGRPLPLYIPMVAMPYTTLFIELQYTNAIKTAPTIMVRSSMIDSEPRRTMAQNAHNLDWGNGVIIGVTHGTIGRLLR